MGLIMSILGAFKAITEPARMTQNLDSKKASIAISKSILGIDSSEPEDTQIVSEEKITLGKYSIKIADQEIKYRDIRDLTVNIDKTENVRIYAVLIIDALYGDVSAILGHRRAAEHVFYLAPGTEEKLNSLLEKLEIFGLKTEPTYGDTAIFNWAHTR